MMSYKRLHTLFAMLAALVALALLPSAAMAAGGAAVRADCLEDGELNGSYGRAALQEALSEAPSNEDEYGGDCRDIIRQTLASLSSGGGGGGGGRTAATREGDPSSDQFADTDADQKALDDAVRTAGATARGGSPPRVSLGGESVIPAVPAAAVTASPNELPLPVALALASLAVLGFAAGTLAMRRRFPDARRVARRIARR